MERLRLGCDTTARSEGRSEEEARGLPSLLLLAIVPALRMLMELLWLLMRAALLLLRHKHCRMEEDSLSRRLSAKRAGTEEA